VKPERLNPESSKKEKGHSSKMTQAGEDNPKVFVSRPAMPYGVSLENTAAIQGKINEKPYGYDG
jgi:hypothetical protein